MFRHAFTEQELRLAYELREAGVEWQYIAEGFGCTAQGISRGVQAWLDGAHTYEPKPKRVTLVRSRLSNEIARQRMGVEP